MLIALVPLAFVLFFVVSQGITSLNFDFFTQMPKPVGEPGGGMANAIVGTLIVTGLGSLMAIPIGVMSGVYMSEYAGTRLSSAVRFAADTLNGVPSIVIGVFAYGIAVLPFKQFSALAGGVALGIMMIPIIARTTEELLLLVPNTMREGALALGATRARAVFSVVLPAALPGIVTGIVLALARIAGETAPLLFTSFNNRFFTTSLTAADRDADRAGLHLRHFPVRGLAPAGMGRRACAGHDRVLLLAARARRHTAYRGSPRPLKSSVSSPNPACYREFTREAPAGDRTLAATSERTHHVFSQPSTRWPRPALFHSTSQGSAGWEVKLEADQELARHDNYHDWHRVERARAVFALEVSELTERGWQVVAGEHRRRHAYSLRDAVPQHPDPLDFRFDDVAVFEVFGRRPSKTDAFGRAGRDDVARLDRHSLREVLQDDVDGKDHVARGRVLPCLAVDPQRDALASEDRRTRRP